MNVAYSTGTIVVLALFAGLAGTPQQARADIGAECRQEAELYGIPPEQFQDYLDGCILSRGGYPVATPGIGIPEPGVTGSETESAPEDAPEYVDQPGVEPAQEAGYGAQ